ncbi:hypothetical protein vseg_017703 [Gypsophila vaccaria]
MDPGNNIPYMPNEEEARRKGFKDAMMAMMVKMNALPQGGGKQSAFEKFSKQRPPTYSGSNNPVELTEWLEEMEKLLDLSITPPRDRVMIAAYYLKGAANNWWRVVKDNDVVEMFTWNQFRSRIQDKYFGHELRCQKEEEFMALRMGDMSLQAYTDKFQELSRFGLAVAPNDED